MSRDQRDDLDLILDAALRDYSNVQPRAGLEQRVLRRMHAPAPRPWWLVVPIFAAATLLVVFGTRRTDVATLSLHPPPMLPAPLVAIARPVAHARPRGLPRLDRFPQPEPLTPGELAFVRFIQARPDQAREALVMSEQIEPLDIEPIKIAELP
jgi:hypothetical protein